MASFVFETIVISVVWFVSKADQAVEFPVVHFFCNDIIRMSMEQIQDFIHGTAMSADQIDKLLDKFISGSVIMHIDSALLWNMETEAVVLVGNLNVSEFVCNRSRKHFKTCLHLISSVSSIEEVIQRRKRIVQTDILPKKSKLRLLFFDDVD